MSAVEPNHYKAAAYASDLLARGYVEIPDHNGLRPGVRVRHVGEQYPGASEGTATVLRVFKSPRVIQGDPDVELIVKRDKPSFWGEDYGYWADYHTVLAEASE